MKTRKMSAVDRLVDSITAFHCWADMLACLKRGYRPTLSHTASGLKLAGIVEAHGFSVYMPSSGQPQRR